MLLRFATVALVCFGMTAAQTCGGSFSLSGDGAILKSPNYPNAYENNLNCLYTYNVETGDNYKGIEVNSIAFDLENNYDCVEFFESDGKSAGKFCGTSGPNKLRLSSSVFTILFKTDSSVQRTGFAIRMNYAKCRKGEGSCPNHPDVCLASNAWCNGQQNCPDNADEDCPAPGDCGKSAAKPHSRIVGGEEVVPNSHPWQAAMVQPSGFQFCGGTVIHPEWIMTAAHCCEGRGPGAFNFRIGAHRHADNEDGASTVAVSQVIMHPSYNRPVSTAHDFCLCKTAERMRFTNKVQPACFSGDVVPDNATVVVTGWGNTGPRSFEELLRTIEDIESGKIPKEVAKNLLKAEAALREATVQTTNQQVCNSQYNGGISDDMLCAAAPGKDSCQGDSGGPLTYEKDGKRFLEGVVSWGYGCARPTHSGVYGRMSYVYPWILETIATN